MLPQPPYFSADQPGHHVAPTASVRTTLLRVMFDLGLRRGEGGGARISDTNLRLRGRYGRKRSTSSFPSG